MNIVLNGIVLNGSYIVKVKKTHYICSLYMSQSAEYVYIMNGKIVHYVLRSVFLRTGHS